MSSALRIATRHILRAPISARPFTVASFARADIVTDLYLKSLKEFKPTPAKSSDSEGQVKTWSAPAAPPAPEAAANVASELSAYESAEVESASADGTAKSTSENEGDWFELDTSPDHAHH